MTDRTGTDRTGTDTTSAHRSGLIVPLIVCGGAGTRLWPASRASRPKQFLPLFGALSTFQETVRRVADPSLFARPVVVTGREHRFLVAEQLGLIGAEADIVLEPEARDSGPAIGAGTAFALRRDGGQNGADVMVLMLAADHMVRDVEGFRTACRAALPAARSGLIVTFGIEPAHPTTGYGYIEPGEPVAGDVAGSGAGSSAGEATPHPELHVVRRVARFVEKPDAATAHRYMAEGYLWNSGNFLFGAGTLLGEYAASEPDTAAAVREAVDRSVPDLGFTVLDAASFSRAAKRSIDYAVMERSSRMAVAPATFDWSDVGSWDAVRELLPQDEAGNAAQGAEGAARALFVNARANMVASDGPLVAVVGLDELAVIATGDAVLVARREDAAGIKALVERLKASHPGLASEHLQSFRPWGNYRSLDRGTRHQVKRIVVKPGGRLSLQRHHHRSEHWIVVRGTAQITVGESVKVLHENESIYIPIGSVHRMENPGRIDLEIIEVQTGSYLGEDDIVRLEDVYNRNPEGATG